jgi:hypothetical protein
MGSSYMEYRERGFWARDFQAEVFVGTVGSRRTARREASVARESIVRPLRGGLMLVGRVGFHAAYRTVPDGAALRWPGSCRPVASKTADLEFSLRFEVGLTLHLLRRLARFFTAPRGGGLSAMCRPPVAGRPVRCGLERAAGPIEACPRHRTIT